MLAAWPLSPTLASTTPTTRIIFSFAGGDQGAYPVGGLLVGADGALTLPAAEGGTEQNGFVYRLTPPAAAGGAWRPTILHEFTGGTGGGYPLYLTAAGSSILGTALDFGIAYGGLVFELDPPAAASAAWRFSVPHSFAGPPDGSEPSGSLVRASDGRYYGLTSQGGGGGCADAFGDVDDCGIVYALRPPSAFSHRWQESVVLSFGAGEYGHSPVGRLLPSSSGALYGVTTSGGEPCTENDDGCGVVFALTPPAKAGAAWSQRTIYRFYGGDDGAIPADSLIADPAGVLYGIAGFGGVLPGFDGYGFGTVFELVPPAATNKPWAFKVLYRFKGGSDGFEPQGALLRTSDGTLYGTTYLGGPNSGGTLFSLTKTSSGSWRHAVLHGFGAAGGDGRLPVGSLASDRHGHLFGAAYEGGAHNFGAVFMVDLAP